MKPFLTRIIMLALAAGFALASCGGGGSITVSSSGGIGGTGIVSQGQVTAIGSITVNGVRYETNEARIMANGKQEYFGDAGVSNLLDVGKVVTVEGILNRDRSTGVATRVIYNDNVEGPVESIRDLDAKTKEIVVLGQIVIADRDRTVLKHNDLKALARNSEVVEVSGQVDAQGRIRATYLERTGEFFSGMEVEVKGVVQNLGDMTFEINGLKVDYRKADTGDLPGSTPANGMYVEVKGTLDSVGGGLQASKIEQEFAGVKDAPEAEIEGFVTAILTTSPLKFKVGNQIVQADDNIRIEGEVEEDIEIGDWIEVEGRLVSGILFAEEISPAD